MDFWIGEIRVLLKVRRFRVGGAHEDVDLGSVPMKYSASSIKGLLRKAMIRVLNSLELKTNAKEEEIFGKEDSEGKLQVVLLSDKELGKNIRYGIKINPLYNSVEQKHLFSYSFLEVEEIRFALKPIMSLSKEEAKLILFALNYLRYDTVGGFGSRGMGLIEEVEVDEKFKEFCGG